MKLKLLSLMFVFGLFINTGCSMFNGDETADTESAEASDPALDAEGAETAEMDKDAEDLGADEEVVAEDGTKEDALPEESLDEGAEEELVAEDGTATEGKELEDGSITESTETAATDAADDESVFDEEGTSTETAEAAPAPVEAPMEEAVAPVEDTSSLAAMDSTSVPAETPAPVAPATLKKIKDTPYKEAGLLLNTVYIARNGDTWKGVSEKIYAENKSKDLKKGNPYLSYRELKVGDKVYYNSPKRPEDAEKMLTYYEDSGIPAQSYVAKAGDNIRSLSQGFLGHENSWKEVWATNFAVESKGELPEGTEIRYWPESAVAAAPAPAEVAPEVAAPEPTPVAAATPAPPKDDFSLPDDMQNQGAAAGAVAVEPPPPPPPPAPAPQKTVASSGPMDKDLTFMLSAGGLLLVGVGVLLGIVRKSKARKMSMNTHTQI